MIVFDEAHNLEGVASDAWSVEISTMLVALVQEEMEQAWSKWQKKGRSDLRFILPPHPLSICPHARFMWLARP